MGLDYCRQTLTEQKRDFRARCTYHNLETGAWSKYLKTAPGTGGYWVLREYFNPKEHEKPIIDIIYVKIHQTKGEVGYQAFSADRGPHYYDCPGEWLDLFQPTEEYGVNWKAKAVAFRDFWKSFTIGKVYQFNYCKQKYYRIIGEYSKKFYLVRTKDGNVYKCSKDSVEVSFLPVDNFPE